MINSKNYNIIALSEKGLKDDNNEDAYLIRKGNNCIFGFENSGMHRICTEHEAILIGLADGVGGGKNPEMTSKKTMLELSLISKIDSEQDLEEAVFKINKKIYENKDCGYSTLIGAILRANGSASFVNVGDSRIYLLRDKNVFELSTVDSNLHSIMIKENMDESEAQIFATLNNAIGLNAELQNVHSTEMQFRTGDVVLCATDGIWTLLSDAGDLEKAAQFDKHSGRKVQFLEEQIAYYNKKLLDDGTVIIIS